mgnify:CR=1 FL=1
MESVLRGIILQHKLSFENKTMKLTEKIYNLLSEEFGDRDNRHEP